MPSLQQQVRAHPPRIRSRLTRAARFFAENLALRRRSSDTRRKSREEEINVHEKVNGAGKTTTSEGRKEGLVSAGTGEVLALSHRSTFLFMLQCTAVPAPRHSLTRGRGATTVTAQ